MYGASESSTSGHVHAVEGKMVIRRRSSAQFMPEVKDLVVKVTDVEMAKLPSTEEQVVCKVYVLAACAALNSCNLGFTTGIMADAGPLVKHDFNLTIESYSLFMSTVNFMAILGALFGSQIADMIGRRKVFITSSLVFIIGQLTLLSAPTYEILMLGRAVTGLGVGLGFNIDPMYISEIAPPVNRGWLVTWSETGIAIGILLGFVVGWLLSDNSTTGMWRHMFAFGLIIPCLMCILACSVMMESPRWLVRGNQTDEAAEVLKAIFPEGADVPEIVSEIEESLAVEERAYHAHGWSAIFCPGGGMRLMLLVGIGVVICQQLTGVDILLYYMQDILLAADEKRWDVLARFPVFLGTIKLTILLIAGPLFDRFGRRSMLLTSLLGCATALFALGGIFFSGHKHPEGVSVLLVMFFGFFSLGIGPASKVLPPELLSNSVRAKGICVASTTNRSLAAIVTFITLFIVRSIGWGALFAVLGVNCLLFALLFHVFLPETQGQTLEDISAFFAEMARTPSLPSGTQPDPPHAQAKAQPQPSPAHEDSFLEE
mmetsp:Transcript_153833/g.271498  ORF Transcript_153833/g.271498 Transcript_153833/m.271498 type:complete len:543 (-) Transcript_153833:46-1674(-)